MGRIRPCRRGRPAFAATARRSAWRVAATRLICAVIVALLLPWVAAAEPAWHRPVKAVADARMTVATPAGAGEVPVYLSADWSHPLPNIFRAVIVVHGVGRDADGYLRGAEAARAAAGPEGAATLLIVPQFLADIDVTTFRLPPAVLHWSTGGWSEGEPAHGPAPLSSFDVFDTILQRLADRALLPNLAHVVLAGHSGRRPGGRGYTADRAAVFGRYRCDDVPAPARGAALEYRDRKSVV